MQYGDQPNYYIGNGKVATINTFIAPDTTCLDYIFTRSYYAQNKEANSFLDYYNHENLFSDYLEASSKHYENTPPVLFDITVDTSRSLPLSYLNRAYANSYSHKSITNFYPIATRYIAPSGHMVIERPPFQLDIDYKIGRASSSTKKRLTNTKIWIPWTIFIFNPYSPTSYRYFFSSSSLSTMDHNYVSPYIPNTYNNGDICFSNSLSFLPQDSLPDPSDPSHFYAAVFNDFFSGGWNSDLTNPWSTLLTSIASDANKNSGRSEFIEKYPYLARIIYPSEKSLKPILSKSAQIRNAFETYQSNPDATYSSICHHLDSSYFHYYILYMMSTFDLPEVLALIDEVFQISYPHKHHNVYSFDKIVKDYTKIDYHIPTLVKLSADSIFSNNSHLLDHSSIDTFSTKLLVLYPNYLPSSTSPKSNYTKSHVLNGAISHDQYLLVTSKIVQDYFSNKSPSSRIYIFDSSNSNFVTSHLLNTSISNIYHSLLKNDFSIPSILSEVQHTHAVQ